MPPIGIKISIKVFLCSRVYEYKNKIGMATTIDMACPN